MDFGQELNYAITQIKLKCSYRIFLNISKQLWKESLNSDTQQIHQYQQNQQPPLTSKHLTQKKTWHMELEGHPVNQGEACLWWKFIDRTHVFAFL